MLVCGGIGFGGRLLCVQCLEENSATLEGHMELVVGNGTEV